MKLAAVHQPECQIAGAVAIQDRVRPDVRQTPGQIDPEAVIAGTVIVEDIAVADHAAENVSAKRGTVGGSHVEAVAAECGRRAHGWPDGRSFVEEQIGAEAETGSREVQPGATVACAAIAEHETIADHADEGRRRKVRVRRLFEVRVTANICRKAIRGREQRALFRCSGLQSRNRPGLSCFRTVRCVGRRGDDWRQLVEPIDRYLRNISKDRHRRIRPSRPGLRPGSAALGARRWRTVRAVHRRQGDELAEDQPTLIPADRGDQVVSERRGIAQLTDIGDLRVILHRRFSDADLHRARRHTVSDRELGERQSFDIGCGDVQIDQGSARRVRLQPDL